MMPLSVRNYAITYFGNAYEELLSKHIYKDAQMYKQLMSKPKVKKAFRELLITYTAELVNFYEKYPKATYMEELAFIKSNSLIKQKQQEYYDLTNDTTAINFLHIYTYFLQEVMYDYLDEYGVINTSAVDDYFKFAHRASISMYLRLKKDIDKNNYWWLKDTASSLRRQLCERIVVFSTKRMQALCDKYYTRKVDVLNEFFEEAKRGGPHVQELLGELDEAVRRKYGATPMFCWWGRDNKGQVMLFKSKEKPETDVYSFIAYTTTPNAERTDNQR